MYWFFIWKFANTHSKKGYYYRIQIHKSGHTRIYWSRDSRSIWFLSFCFSFSSSCCCVSFGIWSMSLCLWFYSPLLFALFGFEFDFHIFVYLLTVQTIFNCLILDRMFLVCLFEVHYNGCTHYAFMYIVQRICVEMSIYARAKSLHTSFGKWIA